MSKVIDVFLMSLTVVGVIGVIEQLTHQAPIIYRDAYSQETVWYNHMLRSMEYIEIYRNTTTLGHFLINATYFLVGILLALTRYYESSKKVFLCMTALFLFNLVFTYSRAAVLILILLVFVIILKNTNFKKRRTLVVFTSFILLSLVFMDQIVIQFILKPLNLSESSFVVRIDSLSIILNDAFRLLSLIGSGSYTAANLRNDLLGLSGSTNFEIGWIISMIEIGLANFFLYVVAIYLAVKHSIYNKKNFNPYLIPLIGVILMFASFNSFGNRTTVNCLLWLLIAILVASARLVFLTNEEKY